MVVPEPSRESLVIHQFIIVLVSNEENTCHMCNYPTVPSQIVSEWDPTKIKGPKFVPTVYFKLQNMQDPPMEGENWNTHGEEDRSEQEPDREDETPAVEMDLRTQTDSVQCTVPV